MLHKLYVKKSDFMDSDKVLDGILGALAVGFFLSVLNWAQFLSNKYNIGAFADLTIFGALVFGFLILLGYIIYKHLKANGYVRKGFKFQKVVFDGTKYSLFGNKK